MKQILESQQTPHTSTSRASYGVSLVRILEKIDRVITALHCSWLVIISVAVNYRYSRYKIDMTGSIDNRYGFYNIKLRSLLNPLTREHLDWSMWTIVVGTRLRRFRSPKVRQRYDAKKDSNEAAIAKTHFKCHYNNKMY